MRREILIVPVGDVSPEVVRWLVEALGSVFDCSCRTITALPRPDYAWDNTREQYRAETVLARVSAGHSTCALAVADLDMFVPDLNFVFGLAQRGMARAIIALPRLRQSYYGLHEDITVFRERVIKEAVHELGHVFGLSHCDDSRCVMAFSNSLRDTDRKRYTFCRECKERLQIELIER